MTRSATGLLPPLEHRPVGRGELVTREPLRNVGARELSGEPVRPAVGDTRDLVGHLPGQIRGTPGELCSLSSSKKKRTSLEPDRPPCTRVQGDRDLGVAVGVDGLCSDESLSLIPVVARLPTTSRGRHISPSIGESRPRRWLRSRLGTPPRSGPPALFRGCPGLSPARSAIVNDGFTATWGHSHRRQYLRGGQLTIHIQSTASTEGRASANTCDDSRPLCRAPSRGQCGLPYREVDLRRRPPGGPPSVWRGLPCSHESQMANMGATPRPPEPAENPEQYPPDKHFPTEQALRPLIHSRLSPLEVDLIGFLGLAGVAVKQGHGHERETPPVEVCASSTGRSPLQREGV